jgi:5S rRNA maturation endonuclease (ribonuclease M5)
MKFNPNLKADIEKFKSYAILVEGKKDTSTLKSFGFERVFEIHKTGIPLRERLEQISLELDKKDKVCILTDLDKRGKKLYETIKPIAIELGMKLDSTFRGILIKSQISHIEGLSNFLKQIEQI